MTDRSGVVCLYMICTPVDVIVFVFAYLCRSLKVTEAQTDPVLLKEFKGSEISYQNTSKQRSDSSHEGSRVCVLICAYVPLCVYPAWRQWRRKAQSPMMHLFSLFCRVRAACGFVCLSRSSRLVASEARSRSLPFPPLPDLSRTFIHSFMPIGHRCPLLSLLSLSSVVFRLPSLFATKLSFAHSFFRCSLPLFLKTTPCCPFLQLSHSFEFLWSPSYCLLPLTS